MRLVDVLLKIDAKLMKLTNLTNFMSWKILCGADNCMIKCNGSESDIKTSSVDSH